MPRDFVEIPSRVLEHFFWDRNVLRFLSGHYTDATERLPESAIDKMIASHSAPDGLGHASLLMQSLYDLKIHATEDHQEVESMDLQIIFNKLRKEIGLLSGPEDLGLGWDALYGFCRLRFPMSYDSSYYSYLL